MADSLTPFVYWGQKNDQISLRIELRDVSVEKVDITDERLEFLADAVGSQGHHRYGFEIDFYLPVSAEGSKYRLTERAVEFQILKKGEGEVWPRLTEKQIKLPWLKVDFDKYAFSDSSEDESTAMSEQEANEELMKKFEKEILQDHNTDQLELKIAYLFMYNMFQFVGYFYIVMSLIINYFRYGEEAKLGAFESVGTQMMVCQAAAVLEVIHPAIGLVKTGVFAPAVQVLGRNMVLFVAVLLEPRLQDTPAVFYLFMTWSLVELIRYPFYMLSSVGLQFKVVTWLRYSAWIPLYPLGIFFEGTLLIMAIPLYTETGRLSLQLPNAANFALYYPWVLQFHLVAIGLAGYKLMNYMYLQRKKKLYSPSKSGTTKKSKKVS